MKAMVAVPSVFGIRPEHIHVRVDSRVWDREVATRRWRRAHHVDSTPLLDTPSWKSSAPSEFVDFHHKFIHLIFLSGPRHRDTGTVTAYLIIFIFLDFRRQPFLAPVPPLGAESVLTKVLLPLRYFLAIIRTSLVLLLALVYVISVRGVCLVLVKLYV
jgi:hypothetical protein